MSFNARSASSPGSDSVPCPINCALLPTLTVVSKEIVVVLSAFAPETSPPVVPLILSVSNSGLRNTLPASTEICFARICDDAPIVDVTTLVTLLSISAPAPASRPPANVCTRPFNVVVLTAPRSNESVSVTMADVPIVASTVPVCVVIAVADAPAATPPPPARLSAIWEWSRVAATFRDPPVMLAPLPIVAETAVDEDARDLLTPTASNPAAKLSAFAV